MTYIITGACGYVGYAIVKELINKSKKVRCFALEGEDCSHLIELHADIYYGDIVTKKGLEELFDCDDKICAIHCASLVSTQTKINKAIYDTNVIGTKNIIDMCEKTHADLIYMGSVDAVPPINGKIADVHFDPEKVYSAYAKTKAMASNLVLESAKRGLRAMILMPCAVFGPYDHKGGLVSSLVKIYLKPFRMPIIRGGYEFTDVRDIAFAAVSAAANGKSGESYILSNEFFELKYVVDKMRSMEGLKPIKLVIPNFIAKAAGMIVEKISLITKKRPLFTAYMIDCVNTHVSYSCEAAKKDLGYSPRPFDETVKDTLDFMKTHGYLK